MSFLLVTRGRVHIAWNSGVERGEEEIGPGQTVLLPAILDEYQLTAQEFAQVFQAGIPLPN